MPLHGEALQKTYSITDVVVKGVWISYHAILGEHCIQKTYEPPGREDAIAFAEPRLLNDLDHPHITPLREAQFDPDRCGHVTIVMRLYQGGSIFSALDAGYRFSVGNVIVVTQHVADALAYLHTTKRYVHRDIKPKNIFLDETRRIGYLGGFGSAAALYDGVEDAKAARTTQLYQASEAASTGRVGPAADIYALGLTAFEMLNGLFPYSDLDPAEIDQRVNQGRRALPDRMLAASEFAPHVPPPLRRLVRRMIEINPRRRPSAGEVLRQLRDLKCVDWRHATGDGLDGEWTGRWPPCRRPDDQIQLRLTSTILRAGKSHGQRRLNADYLSRTSSGWRTVGVAPQTVDAQDAAAVSAFFSAVDTHVARRWPA